MKRIPKRAREGTCGTCKRWSKAGGAYVGRAWCMKKRKTTSMNDTCPDHAEDLAPVTPSYYPSDVQTATGTPQYDD